MSEVTVRNYPTSSTEILNELYLTERLVVEQELTEYLGADDE